ncbi:helicase-related protein [Deinococcus sp. SL84]|uniref:helicase-related protein n=1 Tax=Deinococcus sp. SL84 TaxID=2994663 RepID=UPI0022748603|nr:helicase-related protein [Deinococcus sp. SL84]MCY1703938.1 helicase-related protein [Deinococcus sp. SL84]
MFAGTAPGACPNCGSNNFYRHYGNYHCNACGHGFKKEHIDRSGNWDQLTLQTQEDFLSSRLPVLVSTKGFGMGIDKQNVRLVTHYVMSGSLEAYYQEAGRAGRSGEHAHVALVTVPPAKECVQRHMDQLTTLSPEDNLPFPCLSRNAAGFPALSCPYGLTELCDVAQQALFIQENFPSARQDLEDLIGTFGQLRNSQNQDQDPEINVPSHRTGIVQRALSRLATLSVIQTYVKRPRGFKVRFNPEWTPADALRGLDKELRGFDQQTGAPGQTLPELQAMLGSPDLELTEYVEKAGKLLIDTLYSNVRSMRIYSLLNLYRFSALPPGQCRRVYLRRSFEVTPIQEDYKCGFCDTCQPDLQFERAQAYTPVVLSHEEALGVRFVAQLEQFNIEEASVLLWECQQAGVSASLLTRSNYLLEQRPNDLGLLFMNVALYGLEDQAEQGQRVAQRAVQVMRRAGYQTGNISNYLSALDAFIPELGLSLYAGVGGPFDDPAGRRLALEALGLTNTGLAHELRRRWLLSSLNDYTAHIIPPIDFKTPQENV